MRIWRSCVRDFTVVRTDNNINSVGSREVLAEGSNDNDGKKKPYSTRLLFHVKSNADGRLVFARPRGSSLAITTEHKKKKKRSIKNIYVNTSRAYA